MSNKEKYGLAGSLSNGTSIVGTLSGGVVTGTIRFPKQSSAREYTGDYVVTPTFSDITLNTKGFLLTDNVLVEAIPYSEEENEYGGLTITIG